MTTETLAETITYTTECRTINPKTIDANKYKDFCENFDCYELIPNDRKIKPYFDIEIKPKHCNEGETWIDCWEFVAEIAMSKIIKYFPLAKVEILNASSEKYISCDDGEEKWITSLHLIIYNYKISKTKCLSIVNLMNKEFNKELYDPKYTGDKLEEVILLKKDFNLFDDGVYDPNRKIRSAGANKTHFHRETMEVIRETRPMVIENNGVFENTVISAFFDPLTTEIDDDPVNEIVANIKANQSLKKRDGLLLNAELEKLIFFVENGFDTFPDHLDLVKIGGALANEFKQDGEDVFLFLAENHTSQDWDLVEQEYKDKYLYLLNSINEKPVKIGTIYYIFKKADETLFKKLNKEWNDKVKAELKRNNDENKAKLKAIKDAEKAELKAEKQAEKDEIKSVLQAEKEVIKAEKEKEKEERRSKNVWVDNDDEAIDIILNDYKDRFIYCKKKMYFKVDNKWLNDDECIANVLLKTILEYPIYRSNEDYQLLAYTQNVGSAKQIREGLLAKISVIKNDDTLYEKFHTSTTNMLCFKDGVLNFKEKTFTEWASVPKNTIYTTIIIDRPFKSYFNNPDRIYINKIKEDIYENMYGLKTKEALTFFSRAISGNNGDKNFQSYTGNRNCGKGVLFDGQKASFGDYVIPFNLDNMLSCRENKKSSDNAKENAWLMPMEYARLGISQETEEDEGQTKKELKVSNKVMKSIMSGGDGVEARGMRENIRHFTLDVTLCSFGNFVMKISGSDSGEQHLKYSSVKQFVTQEKYNESKMLYGEDFVSSLAIKDPNLKNKVKTDLNYINALVYLIYENYSTTSITVKNDDDEEEKQLTVRQMLFTEFTFTKNKDDKMSKELVYELIKADQSKIKFELKELDCIGDNKCRTTIPTGEKDKDGKELTKQVQAFKGMKIKVKMGV
jgi:hypothetical protein